MRMILVASCLIAVASVVHADTTIISLKPGETARLRSVTWIDASCGNLLEAVEAVDIMEAPTQDLKVRWEPGKITAARTGCSQVVDGAFVYVEAGAIKEKLSGPLVIRVRMKSKTGPVQATYRFEVRLYPAKAEGQN